MLILKNAIEFYIRGFAFFQHQLKPGKKKKDLQRSHIFYIFNRKTYYWEFANAREATFR